MSNLPSASATGWFALAKPIETMFSSQTPAASGLFECLKIAWLRFTTYGVTIK